MALSLLPGPPFLRVSPRLEADPLEELLNQTVAAVLGLRGPVVYLAVGLFTWAEAPFFLGLVTPGEMAMAAGGVLASRGQAAVAWVGAAAAAGTVVGNAMGFWLGRRWGERLLELRPLRRLRKPMETTKVFFAKRGEWAIVAGRFASYLRIFVPFLAGASGMSARRFLAFDVPTGILWSVGWVLLGFALGESWGVLRTAAGPAAFLVLMLLVLGLVIRWAAVRIGRREEPIRAAVGRMARSPAALWLRDHLDNELRWLDQRFDPRLAGGLSLTLGFLTLLLGAGGIGLVFLHTRAVDGLALIDFPVLEWMADTRTDEAVAIARTGLRLFLVPGLVAFTLLLGGWLWWRVGGRMAIRTVIGLLGAGLGAHLLDRYVLEGVVPRTQFPAVPVAVTAALMVHVTARAGARLAWNRAVTRAALSFFLVCTVALATIVAGWAAPTGIVLGFALGLTWGTAVELEARLALPGVAASPPQTSEPPTPSEPPPTPESGTPPPSGSPPPSGGRGRAPRPTRAHRLLGP